MKFTDNLGLEGFLKIWKMYPDGTREIHLSEADSKNLITDWAKEKMLGYILSVKTTDPISTFRIGTGGTIDPQGKYPKTVTGNLTSLFSEQVTYSVGTPFQPDSLSATYLVDIPNGTGNGLIINEAGLFTSSGIMFNIKTFPGIPKTSEFSIHFEWTIRYV